jgi:hypothetical protein
MPPIVFEPTIPAHPSFFEPEARGQAALLFAESRWLDAWAVGSIFGILVGVWPRRPYAALPDQPHRFKLELLLDFSPCMTTSGFKKHPISVFKPEAVQ